jgi:hypothetical protein
MLRDRLYIYLSARLPVNIETIAQVLLHFYDLTEALRLAGVRGIEQCVAVPGFTAPKKMYALVAPQQLAQIPEFVCLHARACCCLLALYRTFSLLQCDCYTRYGRLSADWWYSLPAHHN